MTWLDSSRQSRERGSMFIFALGLIFVLNGTLGKQYLNIHIYTYIYMMFLLGSWSWIIWCFVITHFRGFPVWLKYVPGISFRTDNGPFKVCLCSSSFDFPFLSFQNQLFWALVFTYVSLIYLFMLQSAMQKFTQKIVQMMKDEKLFQSQGGPIILSQVW